MFDLCVRIAGWSVTVFALFIAWCWIGIWRDRRSGPPLYLEWDGREPPPFV